MIASMMITESIRIVFSAAAIGPCGSKMFMRSSGVQPRSQPVLGAEVPAPQNEPLGGSRAKRSRVFQQPFRSVWSRQRAEHAARGLVDLLDIAAAREGLGQETDHLA